MHRVPHGTPLVGVVLRPARPGHTRPPRDDDDRDVIAGWAVRAVRGAPSALTDSQVALRLGLPATLVGAVRTAA